MKSGLNVWVNFHIKNFVHQKIQFTSNGKLTFSSFLIIILQQWKVINRNEEKFYDEINSKVEKVSARDGFDYMPTLEQYNIEK